MNDDVLCVLLAARTLIDCEGWTQGGFRHVASDGRVERCMLGAVIDAALTGYGLQANTQMRLRGVLGGVAPMAWNDAPGRTKEEVLSAFDRAIAAEEARLAG